MNLGLRGEGNRGGEDGSLSVQVFCNQEDINLLIVGYNLAQTKILTSFYYVSIGESLSLAGTTGNRKKMKTQTIVS